MGRFLSFACLSQNDKGCLNLTLTILIPVTLIALFPGLYAMFSVMLNFGMSRAGDGDHFDQSYRELPLVKEGIFQYTDNGLYVFAFLLFWATAIGFNSIAALVVVAFNHVYIRVQYYPRRSRKCTISTGKG
jgi:protein-S-isoprenylcysteine O-methyltransferase Ste14